MKTSTLMLMAVTIAGGCGATVHSSASPDANLGQYRTYSFYSSPYKQGKPESLADQEIRSALKQDLASKGMNEATNGSPEALIAYHIVEQQKLEANDVGYGFWGFGGVDMTTYTQGTLVVDFIDPHTKKVFWRGTASEIVNDPNHVDTARLDKAIAKLVNQYPYTVAGTSRPGM